MLGYWRASDLLSEHFNTGVLLHGGSGLLSVDGIKKPSFYGIQFANQMEKYLLGKNENSIITSDGAGNYGVACHNYMQPNFSYYLKKEDEIEANSRTWSCEIRNVKNGT